MSADPLFPLPEPTILWVYDLAYRSASASPVVDAEGRWRYDNSALVGFVGYLSSPNTQAIRLAAAAGVAVDAVALAPNGLGISEEDELIAGPALGLGGQAVPAYLAGLYRVTLLRPNPSHLRVLVSRVKGAGEVPTHGG